MRIYIKYMVSSRCKMLVQEDLKKLGLRHTFMDFGIVEILEDLTKEETKHLKKHLLQSGWELLDNKKSMMIEKTKNLIIEMIDQDIDFDKGTLHNSISDKIGQDFNYLNNLFAETNGITIQQFIILQKIEKIKELLLYDNLTLTQISYRLHYSSVAHLSNQFKKVTGLTPSFYKYLKQKREKILVAG